MHKCGECGHSETADEDQETSPVQDVQQGRQKSHVVALCKKEKGEESSDFRSISLAQSEQKFEKADPAARMVGMRLDSVQTRDWSTGGGTANLTGEMINKGSPRSGLSQQVRGSCDSRTYAAFTGWKCQLLLKLIQNAMDAKKGNHWSVPEDRGAGYALKEADRVRSTRSEDHITAKAIVQAWQRYARQRIMLRMLMHDWAIVTAKGAQARETWMAASKKEQIAAAGKLTDEMMCISRTAYKKRKENEETRAAFISWFVGNVTQPQDGLRYHESDKVSGWQIDRESLDDTFGHMANNGLKIEEQHALVQAVAMAVYPGSKAQGAVETVVCALNVQEKDAERALKAVAAKANKAKNDPPAIYAPIPDLAWGGGDTWVDACMLLREYLDEGKIKQRSEADQAPIESKEAHTQATLDGTGRKLTCGQRMYVKANKPAGKPYKTVEDVLEAFGRVVIKFQGRTAMLAHLDAMGTVIAEVRQGQSKILLPTMEFMVAVRGAEAEISLGAEGEMRSRWPKQSEGWTQPGRKTIARERVRGMATIKFLSTILNDTGPAVGHWELQEYQSLEMPTVDPRKQIPQGVSMRLMALLGAGPLLE